MGLAEWQLGPHSRINAPYILPLGVGNYSWNRTLRKINGGSDDKTWRRLIEAPLLRRPRVFHQHVSAPAALNYWALDIGRRGTALHTAARSRHLC
ncbi:hypothetical protein SKAU_G00030250 [Synaphobranchus kaupii]|uniref:Uncharacterized protein n=1 Tax=Synaphobranchus kaupii TaxID=118154 RepID=A0A9Q1GFF1_SYNKA|nr:hypothetical protein SKAU_G00030250 [Synaphobranchus kaupii]